MHAVTSTARSPHAVHATRQLLRRARKLQQTVSTLHPPFSAAFTGSSQYRVPNPSAASSQTLTLYKLYDTGKRLFLCLLHPSGPISVLTMSDTVNKQLKKRGKRKHGRCSVCKSRALQTIHQVQPQLHCCCRLCRKQTSHTNRRTACNESGKGGNDLAHNTASSLLSTAAACCLQLSWIYPPSMMHLRSSCSSTLTRLSLCLP